MWMLQERNTQTTIHLHVSFLHGCYVKESDFILMFKYATGIIFNTYKGSCLSLVYFHIFCWSELYKVLGRLDYFKTVRETCSWSMLCQVMLSREDLVVSVQNPDGSQSIEHADGTRITSLYQDRPTNTPANMLLHTGDQHKYIQYTGDQHINIQYMHCFTLVSGTQTWRCIHLYNV